MPFLEEMSSLESKYQAPYDAWKLDPSPANSTMLLKTIEPEIQRGITAHVGKPNPLIRSRARRMALKAVETYDPTKAKLGTHVVNQLQGLKRISRKQTQILKVPERVAMDQHRVEQARLELVDRLGRDPSTREIADYTGLSSRRLDHLRKFKHPISEGAIMGPQGEEGNMGQLPAVMGNSNAWAEVVYSDLDGTNQKIMEWTLGLHGEPQLSNQAIARKLRISPGAVSQRKSAIQRLLNREEELSPF